MDDVTLREQFKINAMHGHDLGVWVCEGSGLYLSPVLFMQALCPEPLPRPLLVKWKAETEPPRAFRKQHALPLIYSECGRLPNWPYHIHLFAPQAPSARAVEETTGLHDWSWAVPISGIILIYDERYDRPPGGFSLNRLIDRGSAPKPVSSLDWAQAQQVPYVIAALGLEASTASLDQFRLQHQLAAEVSLLPGPALADPRRRSGLSQNGGMFSGLFEPQHLAFDRDYARQILDKLFQQIERER